MGAGVSPVLNHVFLDHFAEDLCSIRWSVSAQQHPHLLLAPPLHLGEMHKLKIPSLHRIVLFSFCKREVLLENGREREESIMI